MTRSVAHRVKHQLPRPIRCDECGSPFVALQSRRLMRMAQPSAWALVWYCSNCTAMVGCHEGTDIPFGLMADRETREARFRAHNAFDPLWKDKHMPRDEAYVWFASALGIPYERAHISMLNLAQCEALIAAVAELYVERKRISGSKHRDHKPNWREQKRKGGRKTWRK